MLEHIGTSDHGDRGAQAYANHEYVWRVFFTILPLSSRLAGAEQPIVRCHSHIPLQVDLGPVGPSVLVCPWQTRSHRLEKGTPSSQVSPSPAYTTRRELGSSWSCLAQECGCYIPSRQERRRYTRMTVVTMECHTSQNASGTAKCKEDGGRHCNSEVLPPAPGRLCPPTDAITGRDWTALLGTF